MSKTNQFMIINTQDGSQKEILGKYFYYSFPKLIVPQEKVKEICNTLAFPVESNENISFTDAFRSATGEIHERIEEEENRRIKNIFRIYFRDNKRIDQNILSRELVEETLDAATNQYHKLANVSFDKTSGELMLSDVDYTSGRDIDGYFNKVENLFQCYKKCLSNRAIETMAEKYVGRLNAIHISARGHHYFVPRANMHKIDLLEDFFDAIAQENLFTYANNRNAKYISANSMYVVDDDKQRKKMANEFYLYIGKTLEEYQRRIEHLIRNGNSSQAIFDRWILKIQALEAQKREYEVIFKQNLSGMDEEFHVLQDLCDQFKIKVMQNQLYGVTIAA